MKVQSPSDENREQHIAALEQEIQRLQQELKRSQTVEEELRARLQAPEQASENDEQAEDDPQHDRELLLKLFERIPVMITMYRPDLKMLQFNPAFERVTGWTNADAHQGEDFMEKVYPDPEYRQMVADFMQSLSEGWRDFVMTSSDGRQIPSAWSNIRLSDNTQIGIGIDLCERRQAEQALRQSEDRFSKAFKVSPDALIISHMADGQIIEVNNNFERMFGYTRAQAIGKTTLDLNLYQNPQDRAEMVRRVQEFGSLKDFEIMVQTRNGELRYISISAETMEVGGNSTW